MRKRFFEPSDECFGLAIGKRSRIGLIRTVCLLASLWALAGCGDGPVVESSSLVHPTLDSLVVTASFASSDGLFGRDELPDSMYATAMDARSQVLAREEARGGAVHLRIPDARLGNGERISVEICGRLRNGTVCEQLATRASAKRYSAGLDVDYPLGGNQDRAGYEIEWRAERLLGDSTWQAFELDDVPSAWLALSAPGGSTVRVPITSARGDLELVGAEGHSDFWFTLRQSLKSSDATTVRAELWLDGGSVVARDTLVVRAMSERERYSVAASYAGSAVYRILDRIDAPRDGRISWRLGSARFDALQSRYEARVSLRWHGGNIFSRDYYDADLTITYAEDGGSAVATLNSASDDFRAKWNGSTSGRTLSLGALDRTQSFEEYDDPDRPTRDSNARQDRDRRNDDRRRKRRDRRRRDNR